VQLVGLGWNLSVVTTSSIGSDGHEDTELHDLTEAREWVTRLTWPDCVSTDRIGVEIEAFPVVVAPPGHVEGRLALHGAGGVLETVDATGERQDAIGRRRPATMSVPTTPGGRITFEPGGQIEYSTAPHETIEDLMADASTVWDELTDAFSNRGVALVSLGIDPWHGPSEVPQQLDAPRYKAMERFFVDTWPAGAMMMRNSAALQVSIDAGAGSVREERWLGANLMAPYLSAMFNTSPGRDGTASLRSRTWRGIDPSRTGLPHWTDVGQADHISDVSNRALAANVMYVLRGEHCYEPGPGWSLANWLERPPDRLGLPRVSDLTTHLSTLFPEVRARGGTLEMRSVDALPRRWWPVPIVVIATLLYDDCARGQVIDLLSSDAAHLTDLLELGAAEGLTDKDLGCRAHKLARLALDTACRDDRIPAWAVEATEEYCERFTMRGSAPADEIRPLLDDPLGLLRWVEAFGA
jgi:glutamate--cysteine ligase